jgi:hypothetical protein
MIDNTVENQPHRISGTNQNQVSNAERQAQTAHKTIPGTSARKVEH